jgi:hypothetical protein
VADLHYAPTFHHDFWVDRRDRCEAEGSNGFNVRFQAIESDLRQLSTVVNDISAAVATITAVPNPTANVVTFTPVMLPVVNQPEWETTGTGLQAVLASSSTTGLGVANFAPPDGVTLTGIRVVGDFNGLPGGESQLSLNVLRAPIRLTNPPTPPVTIASTSIGFQPQHYDTVMPVSPANALVDLNTFRYYLSGGAIDLSGSGNASTLEFVQLQFTSPA